jgi:integrase
MAAQHRRVRIAKGIYKDRGGLAAVAEKYGQRRERRFPLDTSIREIREWQDEQFAEFTKQRAPEIARGTFDADIVTYLKTLADRPALQEQRAKHLAWWADYRDPHGRRLGSRRRYTFTAAELQMALAEFARTPIRRWASRPPQLPTPATVRHYRTALYSLWTTLSGKSAPNPLRDVPRPSSGDPEPRAVPMEVIAAILSKMPDRGQGLRHKKRGPLSKTKARLRVMAYTGITPGQMQVLAAADLHLDGHPPSVLVRGRKKGKGSRTVRLPLIPQGVDAFRAFIAAHAFGRFSTSSARASWWRAIRAVVDELAASDWRAAKALLDSLQRAKARPYDLRHSFLTQAYLGTGDIRATQALATHADERMTRRYTLAAVDPRPAALVPALAARFGSVPSTVPRTAAGHK